MLDGYYNVCKECRKLTSVKYYEENREKINEKKRDEALNNRERKRELDREYYSRNKTQMLLKNKEYRELNSSSIKIQRKQYRERSKDSILEYKKRYYSTPVGKASRLRGTRKRKALKKNQYHPLNNRQIENQLEFIRQRVEKCLGIKHELDHVWPMSKGGLHHIANLRIVPSTVNRMKRNNMKFTHPALTMWYDLPDWLLDDTINWQTKS